MLGFKFIIISVTSRNRFENNYHRDNWLMKAMPILRKLSKFCFLILLLVAIFVYFVSLQLSHEILFQV